MKKFLQDRKRIICILAPLLAGMIYLILCLVSLGHSVSTSEAYSAYLVRFDFGGIWNLAGSGTEPPLYLFLLKIWAHVFGHADFVLRIMSAMFGALTILVAYLWIKYKHGATAAIIGAFLLAIAPFFVRAGQEIGAITLIAFIVAAASFTLQIALDTKSKIWWAIYAIFVAAGLWTSYYCSLAWLAHLVYLAKSLGKKVWQKQIILVYVAAVALWLPWMTGLSSQINTTREMVDANSSLVSVADAVTQAFICTRASETQNLALVLCLLMAIVLLILIVRYHKKMSLLSALAFVPSAALLLLALIPIVDFTIWQIPFTSLALVLMLGVAGTMFVRQKASIKKRQAKTKPNLMHIYLTIGAGAVIIATFACGLGSVYKHEGYDLQLKQKHSADILYANIVEFDYNQYLPIVVKSPDLYYQLSAYTTERNPVTFIEADLSGHDDGVLRPLHQSYFGKIANREKFFADHQAIWLVDVEPKDSAQLDFPYEGWRMTSRSDLHFSDDGPTYQILKLEKEQI